MVRQSNLRRRGLAAIAAVVLLLILDLIVLGMVLGGAREQTLTSRRVETIQAFYAAESGVHMAVREVMLASDEDGDGGVGSISDDGDPGNDPAFGSASASVRAEIGGDQTTLISRGDCGSSRRELEVLLEN